MDRGRGGRGRKKEMALTTFAERLRGESELRKQEFFAGIRPMNDQIVVRIEKPERMTVSKLLWIPETAKRPDYEVYQATVLAVGPGRRNMKTGARVPVECRPGSRVLIYWAFADLLGEASIRLDADDREEIRMVPESAVQVVIEYA